MTANDHAHLSRRRFLRSATAGSLALGGLAAAARAARSGDDEPFFVTRGVVVVPGNVTTWDWPEQAKRAGLTTIGIHVFPHQVAEFVDTDEGARFLERCRELAIEVEHELHSMRDLLPRELFERDPAMFRMNESGDRVPDWNLCVHSKAAVELVCENAQKIRPAAPPHDGPLLLLDRRRPAHVPLPPVPRPLRQRPGPAAGKRDPRRLDEPHAQEEREKGRKDDVVALRVRPRLQHGDGRVLCRLTRSLSYVRPST